MRRTKPKIEHKPLASATFVQYKESIIKHGEFAANLNWLQIHYNEYKNKWVALNNGELIVSGDNYEDIKPYIDNHKDRSSIMESHVGHDFIIRDGD